MPCTDEFFVKRIFSVFDADGSGTVSLAEFIEAMARFSGHNLDSKIEFLFKVNGEKGAEGAISCFAGSLDFMANSNKPSSRAGTPATAVKVVK